MALLKKKYESKQIRLPSGEDLPELRGVLISLLNVDTYQREIDMKWVNQIVANYDPRLFEPILISHRNNTYYVIDGQHRLVVAKMKGFERIACNVVEGLTYEEEGKLFRKYNESRHNPCCNDRFHTDYMTGDKDVRAIVEALNENGLTYSRGNKRSTKENVVNVSGTLSEIYNISGYQGLNKVLRIAKRSWSGEPTSLCAKMLKGLNTYLNTMNSEPDEEVLIKALGCKTPIYIMNIAKTRIGGNGRKENFPIAHVIRDIYEEAWIKEQKRKEKQIKKKPKVKTPMSEKKIVTKDMISKMANLRSQGLSQRKIGERLGVSQFTVCRYLKNLSQEVIPT